MDQPKLERLLRLMKMLIGNVNYTIEEMADTLETSCRSIYRYLETFKDAGFVVYKEGNVYRLGTESKYFKDISQLIHFTEEEAFIIAKLLDGLHDNNLLKQNLRKKLASVYNVTSLADCVVKGRNAANINVIIDSIEKKKQVVFHNYASANTAVVNDRLVEPFAFTTNYIQVWCYDTKDHCNKLFKTARIEKAELKDEDWKYEDKHQMGFIDIFRMSSHQRIKVKLKLGILSHNLLLEEFPLAEKEVKPCGDNEWILETEVCNFIGITRFVLGLADDISIIEPPELKIHIDNFIKQNIL